jgi:predicted N-acyltransferase
MVKHPWDCCFSVYLETILRPAFQFAIAGGASGIMPGLCGKKDSRTGFHCSTMYTDHACVHLRIDDVFNAIHRSSVPMLLPYVEAMDANSWWIS